MVIIANKNRNKSKPIQEEINLPLKKIWHTIFMATQLDSQTEVLTDEPKQFAVFMLNDDYTTWDFCVRIITSVFHKTLMEADAITHDIHTKGRGLCGIYSYEIAETKAAIVEKQAREEGFPMRCRLEAQ